MCFLRLRLLVAWLLLVHLYSIVNAVFAAQLAVDLRTTEFGNARLEYMV